MQKIFVSVLIVNYNNGKYLDRSIKSCLNQKYRDIEIVIYDDKSIDDSPTILRKYKKKNIKIIYNKSKKTGIAAFDAKNGYYRLIKKSKGKIIFLLDSDDYFKKNKIHNIVKIFKQNQKIDFIQDLPIIRFFKYKKKKINKNSILSFWPYLAPESCISFRRKFIQNFILKNIRYEKKYPDVWLGFRLGIYAYFIKNTFFTINKNLTVYKSYGESKKYRFLGFNWFKRRSDSFKYLLKISRNNYNCKISIDYIFTKIITNILKTFN